jgi:hypothetical protein
MTRDPMNLARENLQKAVEAAPFNEWMRKVDEAIATKLCGMIAADLPDCPYRDWFDDGVKPSTAAARAIRAARE